MKIACPDCGPIKKVSSESSIEFHNDRAHDGNKVAQPLENFNEDDLPELNTIPTQHRDSWKEEFEDFYSVSSRDITADYTVSSGNGNDSQYAGRSYEKECPRCEPGKMKHMRGMGTGVLKCDNCNNRERKSDS